MGEAIYVVQDSEQASTMLHPLRLRILELTVEPASATGLAPELGVPRQHVNYHLRELERAGLVELVEERKRGNCVERLYRSMARSYLVAPGALSGVSVDPKQIQDRRSAEYLVALGARLIEDVAEVRARSKTSPTLAIETEVSFENDEARGEFARQLAAAISSLAKQFHRPSQDSQRFRVATAVHEAVGGRNE